MSSSLNRKELLSKAFDALLVTTGVVGLSMASKKLLGEKLTDASSMKDIAKLSVGVMASTMLVKYAQSKKWVPEDPLKRTRQLEYKDRPYKLFTII